MRRREFIAGLGSAAVWPAVARAQQPAIPVVGWLLGGPLPTAELPVQLPTKFEMVVNLKTAKSLGLTVPQSILLSADEVIE
jgi:putative ABC transport system substrate-binding protein